MDIRNPFNHSYDIMFDLAWSTKFRYSVPNDDNRAEDGMQLRHQFESETFLRLPDLGECTILEFLIGLSKRLNEHTYDYRNPNNEPYWFWTLVDHLGLEPYHDDSGWKDLHNGILEIFATLNEREYASNGAQGGLFPLEHPDRDQRDIEIWYQMMAYLNEHT